MSSLNGIPLTINADGTVTVNVGGKPSLYQPADVVDAIARKAEIEAQQTNLAQLSKKAQAMDGLDTLLAANPEASRRVNAIIQAVAQGRPLPDMAGAVDAGGSEPGGAPGTPEVLQLRAELGALTGKIAERERREQVAAEQADARSRLEQFGFLKERPKLLDDAVQSVVALRELNRGDIPTLVRTVAAQKKEALEELLNSKLTTNNDARKLEVEGGSGVPVVSTGSPPPVTKDSLNQGVLRERATTRLEGILKSITQKTVGS